MKDVTLGNTYALLFLCGIFLDRQHNTGGRPKNISDLLSNDKGGGLYHKVRVYNGCCLSFVNIFYLGVNNSFGEGGNAKSFYNKERKCDTCRDG